MTDPVVKAARSAAIILSPDLGAGLPAEVEAALRARVVGQGRPRQYDAAALASLGLGAASLIVSIAQLAWSVCSDQRERNARPTSEYIVRHVHIQMRKSDMAMPPSVDRITEVVVGEIVRLDDHCE